MWMAELASRTGLAVPTIKFYLREGLLPPGEATGATRARYDQSHVRRLRLIRALTEVAGLRLETVRHVLADIEQSSSWHDAIGSAHTRLSGPVPDATPASLERVDDLLARSAWRLGPGSPHRAVLAHALDTMDVLEHPVTNDLLDTYADAMWTVAAAEVTGLAEAEDHEEVVEHAVLGTLLLEPVLLTMRRIAQENASRVAHTDT